MLYCDLYEKLKTVFDTSDNAVEQNELGVRIKKMEFSSRDVDRSNIPESTDPDEALYTGCMLSSSEDCKITTNTSFKYYIFEDISAGETKGIIFLLHGLNEKKWDKYLPWAYRLAKQTGKTVILFPIAFHMNRAPFVWSDTRLMNKVAKHRSNKTNNSCTSFANAALSERLEAIPQRFFLSGLQTYIDICTLIKEIRGGKITGLPANASIDFFGYSIGAFFSLLMMLDNPERLLSDSRLFIFCGGATYDTSTPVSRYIVDKLAFSTVLEYYNDLFENATLTQERMLHYLKEFLPGESHFPGLMNYEKFKDLRQKRLSEIHDRINAISLVKDNIIPADSIKITLEGKTKDKTSRIETMDFDFPYNHVTPFPLRDQFKVDVDYSFRKVFDTASAFLM